MAHVLRSDSTMPCLEEETSAHKQETWSSTGWYGCSSGHKQKPEALFARLIRRIPRFPAYCLSAGKATATMSGVTGTPLNGHNN